MSFEIVIEQGPGSTVNMMFCNSSAFFNTVPVRAPTDTAWAFPAPQTVPVSAPAPGAEAATTPENEPVLRTENALSKSDHKFSCSQSPVVPLVVIEMVER
ncbi:hypothetical protein C8F04DRAFT_1258056 [Mycena alexandri]|uniref:Uncharacterized protein n=1 Tax=Mycena alexandri TaxID=1745969 RepID=A0AAD6T371_9AGAR|nr:hypothetical protein C8F04DRAFT_1258056 [Mycena alexandri]